MIEISGESYDQAKQSLDKIICYFHLKTIENLVITILITKQAYSFTGHFSTIESLSKLQLNLEDNELSIITPELLGTAAILSDLTNMHVEILHTLLDCVELFTWAGGVLNNSPDLDNFTDLALNTVDDTYLNVNRISYFKEVCTIFMPFIVGIEDVDESCFLIKLELVLDNLQNANKAHIFLTMSRECAKESELEFWKDLKQVLSSVGGKTISQFKSNNAKVESSSSLQVQIQGISMIFWSSMYILTNQLKQIRCTPWKY